MRERQDQIRYSWHLQNTPRHFQIQITWLIKIFKSRNPHFNAMNTRNADTARITFWIVLHEERCVPKFGCIQIILF
jgi:hypothetical protein